MATIDIKPGAQLAGVFTAVLLDQNGVPPKDVIRASDSFRIDCTWHLTGGLASSLGGMWHVKAAFGPVGPGVEYRTTDKTKALTGLVGTDYTATIDIPAGATFPGGPAKVPANELSETYQVAVTLDYTDAAGNAGPLAASADLGKVTIYT